MEPTSHVELSLLEGIDEKLLTQLHRAGIRTRVELEARISDQAGRSRLATEVGVSERRMEVLHHLNFLLPEERAGRWFDLQASVDSRFLKMTRSLASVRRFTGVLGLGLGLGLLGVGLVTVQRLRAPDGGDLGRRLEQVEARIAVLEPLAAEASTRRLEDGLSSLGPAPGWSGPLAWTRAEHEKLMATQVEKNGPMQAVSLALARLAELENGNAGRTPAEVAREASALVDEFPPVPRIEGPWDQGAVLVRERLRSRGLGASSGTESPAGVVAALAPGWSSPGFVAAGMLLARLESLPIDNPSFVVWSETVRDLRKQAEVGQRHLGSRAESLAAVYWVFRAELELAVIGVLLELPNLRPYDRRTARRFLIENRSLLRQAAAGAPRESRPCLAWLAVEYEEALALLNWLERARGIARLPEGKPVAWLDALSAVESVRRERGVEVELGVRGEVRSALAASEVHETESLWREPRVDWEARLRPLLMETRTGIAGSSED